MLRNESASEFKLRQKLRASRQYLGSVHKFSHALELLVSSISHARRRSQFLIERRASLLAAHGRHKRAIKRLRQRKEQFRRKMQDQSSALTKAKLQLADAVSEYRIQHTDARRRLVEERLDELRHWHRLTAERERGFMRGYRSLVERIGTLSRRIVRGREKLESNRSESAQVQMTIARLVHSLMVLGDRIDALRH